jgi:hypothetical protein
MNSPHEQTLRTGSNSQLLGTVFGEYGEYNTDNWTHFQLGGNSELNELFGSDTSLYKTAIKAVHTDGWAVFEGGVDAVELVREHGVFRLWLRVLRVGDTRPDQRIFPIIVSTTQLMI